MALGVRKKYCEKSNKINMKILIACDGDRLINPYLRTLVEGLRAKGCDVTCMLSEFWEHPLEYDVIHIQWPDYFVSQMGENGCHLIEVLSSIRDAGIPLICTVHNLVPHKKGNEKAKLAYEIVYDKLDAFVHLGGHSIELLTAMYPNLKAKHVVVPHHTYDTLYNMSVSREEARKKLGIPNDVRCVLSFGAFRNDEERQLLLKLSKRLRGPYYFAPGFYRSKITRKNPLVSFGVIVKHIYYTALAKLNGIHIAHGYIPDNMLPYYLKSADALLVQRLSILNSGNVPLAMLAGLPIIGPNEGNVGPFLKETGNFVFERSNLEQLPSLVEKALEGKYIGIKNEKYAKEHLSTSAVCDGLIKLYTSMREE